MEKKIITLAELKGKEVELRDKIEKDKGTLGDVLLLGEIRLKKHKLESILLWTIISLMLIISGCQTFKGATGDSAWMLQKLSDNVQTEK